jgi:drug/metabolite transporter (DMT)-like permease
MTSEDAGAIEKVAAIRRGASPHHRPLLGGALALSAGLLFSTGGFFVRSVSVDPWEIIFVRCVFAALAITVLLVARERGRTMAAFRRAGWPGIGIAACTGWAIIAYVLAMQYTQVVNVITIMTTATMIVAVLARPLLGEVVHWRTWIAIVLSLIGMVVMFGSDLESGGLYGDLLALTIAFSIAAQTLIARRARHLMPEPAVIMAACAAGIVALPFAFPLEATPREFGMMAALGIAQLAGALTLYFYAARYLPAPTLIFVVLIDALLAPIWVWLGFDEVPTTLGFIGAGIILCSVLLVAVWGLRTIPRAF